MGTIRTARAAARDRAWALAGDAAPGADGSLVPVDIDATIVLSHSEKQNAAATWKKTFGSIPWPRSPITVPARPAKRWTFCCGPATPGPTPASEHIEVTRLALAQLPHRLRRRALIHTDSGRGTHDFLAWLSSPGRRLHYSVGMTITDDVAEAILALPDRVWEARLGENATPSIRAAQAEAL